MFGSTICISGTKVGARYTPVRLFFAEQSGYALAPPE